MLSVACGALLCLLRVNLHILPECQAVPERFDHKILYLAYAAACRCVDSCDVHVNLCRIWTEVAQDMQDSTELLALLES